MPHCQQSAAVVVAAAAAAEAAVVAAVEAYLLPDKHQKWVPATPKGSQTQRMFQSPQLCLAESCRYGHKMHRVHSKMAAKEVPWQCSIQLDILGLQGSHVLRRSLLLGPRLLRSLPYPFTTTGFGAHMRIPDVT